MKRVVITGMGAVTPLGNSVDEYIDGLKNSVVGIDKITRFDTEGMDAHIAAEVKDFNAEQYIAKKEAKRMDLFSQFSVSAGTEAFVRSGLDTCNFNPRRFGVIMGSGIGGLDTMETEIIKMHKKNNKKISPLFIPMIIGNMAAGNLALKLGAKGICTSVVTACATSTHSIGEAFRNIKHGYSDVIIAGGAEASICLSGLAGFSALKALSNSNDPLRSSIPFDKERTGFVMGEGAAALVLEEYEHAMKRGAIIYAEVIGYGANCDAYHMTAPAPDGDGSADAMLNAILEAGIKKEQIDYINAHGTGTPLNDEAETNALKLAFGEYAKELSISSTKSMTGHMLGAAGAVEAIACVLALREGVIPATVGLKVADEKCDLNYTANTPVKKEVRYALSNSMGFGGHNATICLKKWEG